MVLCSRLLEPTEKFNAPFIGLLYHISGSNPVCVTKVSASIESANIK